MTKLWGWVNCSHSHTYLCKSLWGKISHEIFISSDLSGALWPLSPQGLSAFRTVMSLISQTLMHQSSTTVPLTQARAWVLRGKNSVMSLSALPLHSPCVTFPRYHMKTLDLQWLCLGWDRVVLCWRNVKGLRDTFFLFFPGTCLRCVLAGLDFGIQEGLFAVWG